MLFEGEEGNVSLSVTVSNNCGSGLGIALVVGLGLVKLLQSSFVDLVRYEY